MFKKELLNRLVLLVGIVLLSACDSKDPVRPPAAPIAPEASFTIYLPADPINEGASINAVAVTSDKDGKVVGHKWELIKKGKDGAPDDDPILLSDLNSKTVDFIAPVVSKNDKNHTYVLKLTVIDNEEMDTIVLSDGFVVNAINDNPVVLFEDFVVTAGVGADDPTKELPNVIHIVEQSSIKIVAKATDVDNEENELTYIWTPERFYDYDFVMDGNTFTFNTPVYREEVPLERNLNYDLKVIDSDGGETTLRFLVIVTKDNNAEFSPKVQGFARYYDLDRDAAAGQGDTIVVEFDQQVIVEQQLFDDARTIEFSFSGAGNTGEKNGAILPGDQPNEAKFVLGNRPFVMLRGEDNPDDPYSRSTTIDVTEGLDQNNIEGIGGLDALPSEAVDVIPAYVDGAYNLGAIDSTAVILEDFNNDSLVDLLVGNLTTGNRLYLNNPEQNYFNNFIELGSDATQAFATADINNDGYMDVVSANKDSASRMYINSGGSFPVDKMVSLTNASDSRDVKIADLNHDALLDVVFVNYGGGIEYLINQGNDGDGIPQFNTYQLGAAKNSVSLQVADIDSNGSVDLIIGNFGEQNRIYTNQWEVGASEDVLFSSLTELNASRNTVDIQVADVDGDNDLDFVEAVNDDQGGQTTLVYVNENGVFSLLEQSITTLMVSSIELIDYDRDGDVDLFTTNANPSDEEGGRLGRENLVFINNGDGLFLDSGMRLGNGNSTALAFGDVDKDGDIDVAVANQNTAGESRGETIYFNSMITHEISSLMREIEDTIQPRLTLSAKEGVVSGDIDNDGDIDLITSYGRLYREGTGLQIFTNDEGLFSEDLSQQNTFKDLTISQVDLADIDNDGDLDLVVLTPSETTNRIYLNNGEGLFETPIFLNKPAPTNVVDQLSISLAVGDIDNNGFVDLLVGTEIIGDGQLYYNEGGVFSEYLLMQELGEQTTIELGDIDGDGMLELVVGDSGFEEVHIYPNKLGQYSDPNKPFDDTDKQLVGDGEYNDGTDISLVDLDNDKDLDIVLSNEFSASRIYKNMGNDAGITNFAPAVEIKLSNGTGTSDSTTNELADFDGDGDLDLFIASFESNEVVSLLLNDGNGEFAENVAIRRFHSAESAERLILGDFDQDGDVDMAATALVFGGSNLLIIFENY